MKNMRLSLSSVLLAALIVPVIMTYQIFPGNTNYLQFGLLFLGLLINFILDILPIPEKKYNIFKYLIFFFALLITITAAIYQRLTGPTHPKRISYTIDSIEYKSKLIRSGESDRDTKITLNLPINATATLYYKKYKVDEDFIALPFMAIDQNKQEFYLPKMPAAAKLEYYIEILDGAETKHVFKENPIKLALF